MRNIITCALIVALQLSAQAQQKYLLDVKKSKILWKVETIGKHSGILLFNNGTLSYSVKSEPLGGKFNLNMKSMHSTADATASRNEKVDDQLRSESFFDVSNYPTALINVKKIIGNPNQTTFKVSADVTIKGITKSVEFIATIKKNGDLLLAFAQFKIDRRQWNIDYKPKQSNFFAAMKDKFIENDIQLTLNLTFSKIAN
jgi:polyisoprenoid-binding protein YceI